jgi:predicted unusual protein kinase regulating ubiquinone biosynthesis (AarF/ABC1/UbiB family)
MRWARHRAADRRERGAPTPPWGWRRIVGVIGLAGIATGLVRAAVRRRAPGTENGPMMRTSRAARTASIARLGVRSGASEAVHRARRAVAPEDERARLDEEHAMRSAEQVAETLGNLRGALMKLGQMASYLDEGLPEHLRTALSQLQAAAPPMSAALAASVVEAELGGPPDRVFARWDPVPLAAASIGQVHRARTLDGRDVAVKVQYPGVDDAIRADLATAGTLFRGMAVLYPGLDPGPIVAELQDRLLEELDYLNEAANQRRFGDWYAGHPFIHVPAVVDELTTARVLTTELADGVRFDDVLAWPQERRDAAGEAIFRFVFRSIYRLHAFNGDPHPGNYLFHPDGRVTFLDFGLVKYFTDEETDVFASMIRSIVFERDPAAFRASVERAGLLPPGLSSSDADVAEYFSAFYELVRVPEVKRVDGAYASELVRRTFDASGPHGPIMKAANVPPAFVIIQRINLGLVAVLARLGATANWRLIAEELWPWVQGPPSTRLGQQEALWLAERHPALGSPDPGLLSP